MSAGRKIGKMCKKRTSLPLLRCRLSRKRCKTALYQLVTLPLILSTPNQERLQDFG